MHRQHSPIPHINTLSNEALDTLIKAGVVDIHTGTNPLHSVGSFANQMVRGRITMLLTHGADINAIKPEFGNTPLHVFVANERVSELKFFIQEAKRLGIKINFNKQDKEGKNCLIFSAKTRNEALALYLLEQADGKDFNVNLADHVGMTCLHYACALGMPRLAAALLARGASTTTENLRKRQPLDCTTMNDDEVREILRSVVIDPSRDEFGLQNTIVDESNQPLSTIEKGGVRTYKDLPAIKSSRKMVESVLSKVVVSSKYLSEMSLMPTKPSNPIKAIAEHALTEAEKSKILAQVDAMSGISCLRAARRDQPVARDVLIAHSANYAWLLRFYAADNHADLLVLLSLPSIKNYISQGGLPSGKTALHQAAAKGLSDVCEKLIAAGSDLNASDAEGHTPMMLATLAKKSDTMFMLARKGADVSVKNKAEQTIFNLLQSTQQHGLIAPLTEIINKAPSDASPLPTSIFNF